MCFEYIKKRLSEKTLKGVILNLIQNLITLILNDYEKPNQVRFDETLPCNI
jgi:hypothetical protein